MEVKGRIICTHFFFKSPTANSKRKRDVCAEVVTLKGVPLIVDTLLAGSKNLTGPGLSGVWKDMWLFETCMALQKAGALLIVAPLSV